MIINLPLSITKFHLKMPKTISGFSKFNKLEKINWLVSSFFNDDENVKDILMQRS